MNSESAPLLSESNNNNNNGVRQGVRMLENNKVLGLTLVLAAIVFGSALDRSLAVLTKVIKSNATENEELMIWWSYVAITLVLVLVVTGTLLRHKQQQHNNNKKQQQAPTRAYVVGRNK